MDARTHAFRLYGSVDAKAGRLEQPYSIAMASHPTEVLTLPQVVLAGGRLQLGGPPLVEF